MSDVRITYTPETVTCICGKQYSAEKRQKRSGSALEVEQAPKKVKLIRECNEDVDRFNEGKINLYDFDVKADLRQIQYDKMEQDIHGLEKGIGDSCENCGATLKGDVTVEILIESKRLNPSWDDYRKLPLPPDHVLRRIAESPMFGVSDKTYNELLRLKAGTQEQMDEYTEKVKALGISGMSIAFAKSTMKKLPEIDDLINETISKFDAANLDSEYKGAVRDFFKDFKEWIGKEENKDLGQFVKAVERLAWQDVLGR
jgi:hypothetical protein